MEKVERVGHEMERYGTAVPWRALKWSPARRSGRDTVLDLGLYSVIMRVIMHQVYVVAGMSEGGGQTVFLAAELSEESVPYEQNEEES